MLAFARAHFGGRLRRPSHRGSVPKSLPELLEVSWVGLRGMIIRRKARRRQRRVLLLLELFVEALADHRPIPEIFRDRPVQIQMPPAQLSNLGPRRGQKLLGFGAELP